MNTQDIMQLALDLSGMTTVPSDSALFVPANSVTRILMGIDICEADLSRAKADGHDLVIAHHPLAGTGYIGTMGRSVDLMLEAGLPEDVAREACRRNMASYEERVARSPPDEKAERMSVLARDLGIGLMNIHQPCDELGRVELQRVADGLADSASISELMSAYRAIPEVVKSDEEVELVCGSDDAAIGHTVMINGAGTNCGYDVATALFDGGIDTVVYIHLRGQEQRSQFAHESKC